HARRPAVAAPLLRANWWTDGRYIHYAVDGSGTLFDLCPGPEDPQLGCEGRASRARCRPGSGCIHGNGDFGRLKQGDVAMSREMRRLSNVGRVFFGMTV